MEKKEKTAVTSRRKAPEEFKTESVSIADLKPHPRNYRKHSEDQLKHIVESIRQHGLYRNVVITTDNTILAGHGVIEAAKKMKWKQISVIRLNVKPNEPRALKLLAGDNEISNLAENDDRALTELLKELQTSDSLLGTGFDEQQLAALLMITRPSGEIKDFNEAAHWVGMPEFGVKEDDLKIVILFRNKKDRIKFQELNKLKTTYRSEIIWTAWWPEKKQDDIASVRFDDSKEKTTAVKKGK